MDLFETKRLHIRRFDPGDWQDLYEYLSLKDVVKYEPYDVLSEEKCKTEALNRSMLSSFLAVRLKGSNKLIGNIYFREQEPVKFSSFELGYVFNPVYQGKGYATEACEKMLEYGFESMNIRRVVAMCNPQNMKSWKLLERLGFRREGHLIQNIFFKRDEGSNPIWLDTYVYALLQSEWKE